MKKTFAEPTLKVRLVKRANVIFSSLSVSSTESADDSAQLGREDYYDDEDWD